MLAISEFEVQLIQTTTAFLRSLLRKGIRRIFLEVIFFSEFINFYKILAIYHGMYFSLCIDI